MTQELITALMKYNEIFEDGFPMTPLGWFYSDEELTKIIGECLEKCKSVKELGYYKDPEPGVLY